MIEYTTEKKVMMQCAIGRLFQILSRPYRPGDDAEYEMCRRVVLRLSEPNPDHQANYARDHAKGAQGD